MNARELTEALGGRWHGRYGAAPCPVCRPERRKGQNALTLGDGHGGRLVLHCKKSACAFLDILAAAGLRSGDYAPPDPAALARREAEQRAQARRLWQDARPIEGTPAAQYLREARAIPLERLPPTLRYHPEAWHGHTGQRWHALVALVEGAGRFAVHRTFIAPDGRGKAGLEGGDKLMLGATAGGAVRLSDGPGPLLVAEGIETALAAWCLHWDATARAWAALSTSGLRALHLPPQPGRLCIAADGDDPGMAAAHALAEQAHGLGWQVTIAQPPAGADFNDILTGKAAA